MDTLSNAIDKLLTVNLKTWHNIGNNEKMLNLKNQRSSLTKEIDDLSSKVLSGKIDKNDAMRPQHKTY